VYAQSQPASGRFQFIAHALRGDGPFRPTLNYDALGTTSFTGSTYLVRYPRESDTKFARRNEIAFYASPLAGACSRFVGYLSMRPPQRTTPMELYDRMVEDIDGKGNDIDVFWSQFAYGAKARGSMLLLVDMPPDLPATQAEQVARRVAPYWTQVLPESVTDYALGDDGKFDYVEFAGNWTSPDGERVPCTWHFDRAMWEAKDRNKNTLASGEHPLGECPVLIFTEGGDYPHYGPFSAIADLSRRLFNLDSELDEILRAQTFSLLTMQVPDNSTDEQKLSAAKVAGETISTANLLVHSGSAPTFIAPPDGPARIYLDRIKDLRGQIDEIALNVATVGQQESGYAMRMRFQSINGELSRFAERMEDLERRAWDLSARWLGLSTQPTVSWSRDYNLADVESELKILTDMRTAAMPDRVVVEQQKRIAAIQFGALEQDAQDEIVQAIEERLLEPAPEGNVVPLRPDANAPVRDAIVRALGNGSA
jgi:hypothetical protein